MTTLVLKSLSSSLKSKFDLACLSIKRMFFFFGGAWIFNNNNNNNNNNKKKKQKKKKKKNTRSLNRRHILKRGQIM